MTVLVKMIFGSHVYGCNTPSSDQDFKGVYIPSARDIVLGRTPKTSVRSSTGDQHSRNTAEDIDEEMMTLAGYLRLVAEGQVVALDMLFTPDEFITQYLVDSNGEDAWFTVQKFAKEKLLSKNTTAYIGYCRKQADKYGIKGSRMGEVREMLDFLKGFKDYKLKLWEYSSIIESFCYGKQHCGLELSTKGPPTNHPYGHTMLHCCGRKVMMTCSVAQAIGVFQGLYDAYGERTRQADNNEGVDWKATHHAIRCCYEAIELLSTGHITFPLPDREYLLQVKKGQVPYAEVAAQIEYLMDQVEVNARASSLPEQPDWQAMEDFVFNIYQKEVCRG